MRTIIQRDALHTNQLVPTVYPLHPQQSTAPYAAAAVLATKTVNRTSTIATLSFSLPPLIHTPRPLQADPATPSTATTPTKPFHLSPLSPPVDLHAPDTIVPLEPLDDLLTLLSDGASPPVDGAEALVPLAPVIARNRRAYMVLWSAGHLQ